MGAGMALAFARAGSDVTVRARRASSLQDAQASMARSMQLLNDYGAVPESNGPDILGRVRFTTALEDLDPTSELIIESIPERLDDKRALLAEIEALVGTQTVITSNTSSLPLAELASGLHRKERFAGYHWFNPPELVQLVEIVAVAGTDAQTVTSLHAWSLAIGKRPVTLARDVQGFVANRLQYALIREAYGLVEDGVCSPQDVDQAVRAGLGPRWAAVGPFETMDLAGLDVHAEVARQLFPTLSTASEPPAILRRLVEEGALGTKTGKGLLGTYDEAAVNVLAERRARLLIAIASMFAQE